MTDTQKLIKKNNESFNSFKFEIIMINAAMKGYPNYLINYHYQLSITVMKTLLLLFFCVCLMERIEEDGNKQTEVTESSWKGRVGDSEREQNN